MKIKCIVNSVASPTDFKTVEHCFEKEVIKIGRKETNDIHFQDIRRLISGVHAEVYQKNQECLVIDKSRNGTYLNKSKIIPGKEYPVLPGDEIIIGDFSIKIFPLPDSENSLPGPEPVRINPKEELFKKSKVLIEELKAIYLVAGDEGTETRMQQITKTLRQGIQGLDPDEARIVIRLVEFEFPDPEFQKLNWLEEKNDPFDTRIKNNKLLEETKLKRLKALSERYFIRGDFLNSIDEVDQFIERIDRILQIMIRSLTAAVKGRKEFEEEFDVNATRIFSGKPNPIKLAEDEKQVGKFLLDIGQGQFSNEQIIACLEEVFSDLALHQMGLLVGMKESQSGLLKSLDPERLEKEVEKGIWPKGGNAAWNQFKEKYKELTENEVKTFEKTLRPFFARGYLSVQKKKKKL